MNIVELDRVTKRYGTSVPVDHLDLAIERGEIFGFLGPNGAGKSTSIKMIVGLLKPSQGTIKIDGIDVNKHPLETKKRIGFVPQDLAIYPNLTARENILFFAKLYGLSGKELNARADEALEFVGLTERQQDKPKEFSGGMKRRLNIACAIAHRPQLIIMDEPTVGIDPQSRNHILESVKKLNTTGSTIIYTSHYMEEVEAICTRVGILDQGQLKALGTKNELMKTVAEEERLLIQVTAQNPAALAELQQHPRISHVIAEEQTLELYVSDSQTILQDILFILSKHSVNIQSLQRIEPDLETLFLSLTGRKLRD
ncbi:ABC transporter ATP-binding protein [Gorillibacterium massiliense]|uniref:ABC transporter ATP-binding protein n=1 Tax=Gorillibacterium massiliense TaxID=1280390 RepID=UPI0004B61FEF|nr:ABC transporter ATP-binding protein [Gorillibacterium massiliense]